MADKIREFTDAELDTLQTDVRNIVEECVCNGHSYDTVAEKYGLPVGTVKSRINRARAKIAKSRQPCEASSSDS